MLNLILSKSGEILFRGRGDKLFTGIVSGNVTSVFTVWDFDTIDASFMREVFKAALPGRTDEDIDFYFVFADQVRNRVDRGTVMKVLQDGRVGVNGGMLTRVLLLPDRNLLIAITRAWEGSLINEKK